MEISKSKILCDQFCCVYNTDDDEAKPNRICEKELVKINSDGKCSDYECAI